MNKDLERFLDEVQADPQLLERLNSMQTAAEIVEEAAQRGFNFSESDLTGAPEESDEKSGSLGKCGCMMGGGGNEKSDHDHPRYNCGCAVFGCGRCDEGWYPCICMVVGNGQPKPH